MEKHILNLSQDADVSPLIKDDIYLAAVNGEEDHISKFQTKFQLEEPPEPINENDTDNKITEIDDNEFDNENETDDSNFSSKQTLDSNNSTTEEFSDLKPSSLSILAPLEITPKHSFTDSLDNSPYTQSILGQQNEEQEEKKTYPWMDFKLPEVPPMDDTEIISEIDSKYDIKTLIENIRNK